LARNLLINFDAFIVYTSNVFAMLGLRSLYFVLVGFIDKLIYLRLGLALTLVFVALKLFLAEFWYIGPLASLLVIAAIMGTTIAASLLRGWLAPSREKRAWKVNSR
jgi:tellurite resistance protein TerC